MVAALLLLRFFDELASFLPAGTLESFHDDLDLTYAQAGAVLAAIGPGALIGNGAAVAADFVSRRLIVAVGAVAYAGSMFAFASGRSFPVLLGAGLLVGLASTAMVDAGEVALTDVAGDGRLRVLLARGNLLAYAGDLLGPAILIGVAAAGLSWRAAFAIGGCLLLGYAVVLAGHELPAAARTDEDGGMRSHVVAVLRDPVVWVLGGLSVLMSPLDETVVAFGIAYLEEARGLGPSVATAAALATTVGGLLGLLLPSRLQRHDDDHLLVISGLAMAAAVAAFLVLPGVGALVPLLGLGAAVALAWVVLQHRILTARPGAAGTTKAVVSTIDAVALAAPVAVGAAVDAWGLRRGMLVFVAMPAAFALLALIGMHRQRPRGADGA